MTRVNIRERLEAAAPGPWRALAQHDEAPFAALPPIEIEEAKSGARVALAYVETPDDADLIAHAPADLTLLLAVADMAAEVIDAMWKGTAESLGGRLAATLSALEAGS